MYEWIIVLLGYINGMVCWDMRALRTSRMNNFIHEAAGIGEREGGENLAIVIKGSGEDNARRVLEFLEVAREEKRRKEKEEKEKLNGMCPQEYSPQQKGKKKQRRAKEGKKVY